MRIAEGPQPKILARTFCEERALLPQPLAKIHYARLRPKSLNSAVPRDKPAMSPVLWRHKANRRILFDQRGQKRFIRHERIILRGNHQRRQRAKWSRESACRC